MSSQSLENPLLTFTIAARVSWETFTTSVIVTPPSVQASATRSTKSDLNYKTEIQVIFWYFKYLADGLFLFHKFCLNMN